MVGQLGHPRGTLCGDAPAIPWWNQTSEHANGIALGAGWSWLVRKYSPESFVDLGFVLTHKLHLFSLRAHNKDDTRELHLRGMGYSRDIVGIIWDMGYMGSG